MTRFLGPSRPSRHGFGPNITMFLVAAGVAVSLYGQGRFLLVEAFFVVLAPLVLFNVLQQRLFRILWITAALWGGAQIVSDRIHGVPPFSAFELYGLTIALLVSGLYWVTQRTDLSTEQVLASVGAGWIALELLAGEALSSANPWKYGLATPVALLVLAAAYDKKASNRVIFWLLAGLGAVSFVFDSRFQAGLFLICATLNVLVNRRTAVRKRSWRNLLILMVAVLALYFSYPTLALSGSLGSRAQAQQVTYEENNSNFILSTRMELPQIAYLASRHLAIGIGSYSPIDSSEAYGALEWLDENIQPLTGNDESYLLGREIGLPGYNAHSAALSTVLFAGVLALPFWVFLFVSIGSTLRMYVAASSSKLVVPALVLYFSGLGLWDALFSPLTTRSHISIGVTLFIVLTTVLRTRPEDRSANVDDA